MKPTQLQAKWEATLREHLMNIRKEANDLAALVEFASREDASQHPVWQIATDIGLRAMYLVNNPKGELDIELLGMVGGPQAELRVTQPFTHEACATVLAALRNWQTTLEGLGNTGSTDPQKSIEDNFPELDHFEDGTRPLTVDEIDTLCESINLESGPDPEDAKAELLGLLRQDIYTDAPEYRQRVNRIKKLVGAL